MSDESDKAQAPNRASGQEVASASAGDVAALVAIVNVALIGVPSAYVTTHSTVVTVTAAVAAVALAAIYLLWQVTRRRKKT